MADDPSRNFRNPPVQFRFKPGQSGNPKGRPRGARGLKTDLTAELDAKHTIKIASKAVTGTRQRLMLRTLAIRAASGDLKATGLLLGLATQVLGAEDRSKAKRSLSAKDQALLAQIGEAFGWTSNPAEEEPLEEPDPNSGHNYEVEGSDDTAS